MSLRPDMTVFLSGIRAAAPARSASWPGGVADLWEAEIAPEGQGRYASRLPRIVTVLGAESPALNVTFAGEAEARPARCLYVPAGVDLAASIEGPGMLRHLDLHFDPAVLQARLAATGRAGAERSPLRAEASLALGRIAGLIAAEIEAGSGDALVLDSLAFALVGKVFAHALPERTARGGMTGWQLRTLDAFLAREAHRRITVAEMASEVGLSESWFAHAFRHSRGETPLRALRRLRVDRAIAQLADPSLSLVEVSLAAGFADQAHFTRAFRAVTGQTPGAYRRSRSRQDPAISGSLDQE